MGYSEGGTYKREKVRKHSCDEEKKSKIKENRKKARFRQRKK